MNESKDPFPLKNITRTNYLLGRNKNIEMHKFFASPIHKRYNNTKNGINLKFHIISKKKFEHNNLNKEITHSQKNEHLKTMTDNKQNSTEEKDHFVNRNNSFNNKKVHQNIKYILKSPHKTVKKKSLPNLLGEQKPEMFLKQRNNSEKNLYTNEDMNKINNNNENINITNNNNYENYNNDNNNNQNIHQDNNYLENTNKEKNKLNSSFIINLYSKDGIIHMNKIENELLLPEKKKLNPIDNKEYNLRYTFAEDIDKPKLSPTKVNFIPRDKSYNIIPKIKLKPLSIHKKNLPLKGLKNSNHTMNLNPLKKLNFNNKITYYDYNENKEIDNSSNLNNSNTNPNISKFNNDNSICNKSLNQNRNQNIPKLNSDDSINIHNHDLINKINENNSLKNQNEIHHYHKKIKHLDTYDYDIKTNFEEENKEKKMSKMNTIHSPKIHSPKRKSPKIRSSIKSPKPKRKISYNNKFHFDIESNIREQNENLMNSFSKNFFEKASKISFSKTYIKSYISITQAGKEEDGITKTNQDSYLELTNINNNPNFNIFGIFDGHGTKGHLVSQFIVDYFKSYFTSENSPFKNISIEDIYILITKDNYSLIKKIISSSEKKLLEQNDIDCNFSGTTCNLIIHINNKIICSNIGDSRSIMVKEHNKIIQLSYDQKPDDEKERKRIEENNGEIHKLIDDIEGEIGPMRVWVKGEKYPGIAMSRSIGDKVASKLGVVSIPDIKEFDIDNECKFIVCGSDGIWEFLSHERIAHYVSKFYKKNNVEDAAWKLVKKAKEFWEKSDTVIDDITVIVVFLKDE